jgi:hypothetical protein
MVPLGFIFRPLNSGVRWHMKANRKAGRRIALIGFALSAVCWCVCWVFTPAILVAMLIGVPCAYLSFYVGKEGRLAFLGLVMAVAPAWTLAATHLGVTHPVILADLALSLIGIAATCMTRRVERGAI